MAKVPDSNGSIAANSAPAPVDPSRSDADSTAAPDRSPLPVTGIVATIERIGNRLPDQITIFVALSISALLASAAASIAGFSVIHPVTGAPVTAFNLLSHEGLRWILKNAVTNFTGFAPLGVVLVAMIGVGIAERSGLFAAALKTLVLSVPRAALAPTLILAGLLSHTASDAGYVILPPLAAMLYASVGRHPLAGIAATFAGVGAGFSANLVVGTLDPMLAALTQEGARLFDSDYKVSAVANYYFLAASVGLLTLVGWYISDRIVEPRLGPWRPPAASPEIVDGFAPPTRAESRGLRIAGIVAALVVAFIVSLVLPRGGVLRDPITHDLTPFYDSLVPLLMLLFLLPGLAYGVVTRCIRSDRDASAMMGQTMSTMSTYIVLAFFAGQFISWFRQSNLGLIIAIKGADFLKLIHLTGLPLMVAFVLFVALFNLLISSASAKWAMLAPVFVPMFMAVGQSPESTQCFYRIGDSVTNVITPLNFYFVLLLAVARRYMPNAGIGTLIAAMFPFSIAFLITWTVMLVIWVWAGFALGPGAPLTYHVG